MNSYFRLAGLVVASNLGSGSDELLLGDCEEISSKSPESVRR